MAYIDRRALTGPQLHYLRKLERAFPRGGWQVFVHPDTNMAELSGVDDSGTVTYYYVDLDGTAHRQPLALSQEQMGGLRLGNSLL